MKAKTTPNRNKVVITSTLRPQVAEKLNQVSEEVGVAKNQLIEQGLLMLFAARESKKQRHPEEVALG